jgi:phospholipid/cholesterol/gamma-HCH transport system substrate-binding protein
MDTAKLRELAREWLHGRRLIGLIAAVAVLVAGSTVGVIVFGGSGGKHLTAYFDHTIGVYPGSDLRVLGVKVGTIDSVKPEGTKVKVTLTLDSGVRVPADADAVVVAPSVVSDRYIQLTPAYTGGPELADHTVLDTDRTASPLEIDQLYDSLTKLSDALGPNGANKNGALSDVLATGAANLKGNGLALGNTIAQLGKASKTLSGSSQDLFSALTYLQSFTSMLKTNDSKVKAIDDQLASVTGFLADDKDNLSGALSSLATALNQVNAFIQQNRGRISTTVNSLVPLTQSLVDQRASLAETLDTAPLALTNVLNAYDPAYGTINGRADLNELSMGRSGASRTASQLASILPLPSAGTVYSAPSGGAK